MNRLHVSPVRLVSGVLAVGSLIALACGGGEVVEKIVKETVVVEKPVERTVLVEKPVEKTVVVEKVVEKTVVVEKVVEKEKLVVATATPKPVETAGPGAVGPSGKLTVALKDVGNPQFIVSKATYPVSIYHYGFGISETLGAPSADKLVPRLAESWSLATDLSAITINVRRGVQFHDGWGELTADDVVWTQNDGGAVNQKSIYTGANSLFRHFKPWEAVDKYTVRAPFKEFAATWEQTFLLWGAHVVSKKVFDAKGDASLTLPVGTGPFRAKKWAADDRVELEAIRNHWRQTPSVAEVVLLEVPEASTRLAMLETREAEIAEGISLTDIIRLRAKGNFDTDDGTKVAFGQGIYFSGNYWEKKDPDSGEVLKRPTYLPDAAHPWIGNPDDSARQESAKKVRWAMSFAVNRDLINKTILGGLGDTQYHLDLTKKHPWQWRDRWVVSYDSKKAKQFLTEAGYPQGFSTDFFIPSDIGEVLPEVGEAIAAAWQDIGIKVNIQKGSYSAKRPTMVDRTINIPWMFFAHGGSDPIEVAPNLNGCKPGPGWSRGYELPICSSLWKAVYTNPDEKSRLAAIEQFIDFIHDWQIGINVVEFPVLYTFNKDRVSRWDLERQSVGKINGLETVQLRSK